MLCDLKLYGVDLSFAGELKLYGVETAKQCDPNQCGVNLAKWVAVKNGVSFLLSLLLVILMV